MYTTTRGGFVLSLISEGIIHHTIDDNKDNKLPKDKAAMLSVAEEGTVRVTFVNGRTAVLENYNNFPVYLVTKVWATGTTLDHSKIQLSE